MSLSATEWVGVAVLLLGAGAIWSIYRGSRPIYPFVSARTVGLLAIATIMVGFWAGIAVHIVLGSVVLATGCGLSIWGFLLSFGVSWRQHIRPSIIPAIIVIAVAASSAQWPRPTAAILLLTAWWVRRTHRKMRGEIDWQLSQVITRLLVLAHVDTATFVIETWFERFRLRSTDLAVLTLAARARERAVLLPRSRHVLTAAEALDVLAIVAGEALDRRLRTDHSSTRPSSWVRILAKELSGELLRKSGVVAFSRLLMSVLLAVPPSAKQTQPEPPVVEIAPDSEGYVVERVADMPARPTLREARALRRQTAADAATAGPNWLASISAHAERWREEAHKGEQRLELVTEVVWSVYEDTIGWRPIQYDLFYQLSLQAPELIEGLSIREAVVEDGVLCLRLNGVPTTFHGSVSAVVLEDRRRNRWTFRKLETTAVGVDLQFVPEGSSKGTPVKPQRHWAIPA